jgi:hypothetical protein
MTAIIEKHATVQVPAGRAKKAGTAKKRPSSKNIFGLLADWKIDTPAFRDEMRD